VRRLRRRLFPVLPFVVGACVLLLVLAAYVAATAVRAARDAAAVSDTMSKVEADLRSGSIEAARADNARAIAQAAKARREVSGAVFAALTHVPVVGDPLRALQDTVAVVDDVAEHVVRPVTATPGVHLQSVVHGTSFDVSGLAAEAPTLFRAADRLDSDVSTLDRLPHVGFAAIDHRLAKSTAKLRRAASALRLLSDTAEVAPAMLADGRTYLVLVQNNAESRATGGLVGAYAVLHVDHGQIAVTAAGPNNDLRDVATPVLTGDPQFENRYAGLGVTTTWRSLNLTPDFPTAASIASRLWVATGHQPVDGVLAADPVALAQLLRVTGPVLVPGGPALTADNAVQYLESGIYARYPRARDDARNSYLAAVTRSVLDTARSRGVPGTKLVRALTTAVAGRHLQLWSAHADEQSVLAGTPVSGKVAGPGPFLEVVTQNLTGGKLDYYLRRSVSYVGKAAPEGDDVGFGPQPMEDAVISVRLTNTAPDHGLPAYVTTRADAPRGAAPSATNRLWLSLYLARGTGYLAAALDGHPIALHTDEDAGASVLSTIVELRPGESKTLTVRVAQPTASGRPFRYLPQPLAFADRVLIRRT